MKEDKLKKNFNSSGFPFQLAVESATGTLFGWNVSKRGYSWHNNGTRKNGFIDIVAEEDSSMLREDVYVG